MSNLQATSLSNNLINLYTHPIKFDKKEFKQIKVGSWLEILSSSLNVVGVKSLKVKFKAKIYGDNGYIFLDLNKRVSKKFKLKSEKDTFVIKIILNRVVNLESLAIEKNPIDAVLIRDNRDFARVKVYMKKAIFIEVKEIL